jgi:hypothetical protein
VIDDPTVRSYDSTPTPGRTPFGVDEWAKDDSFTQQMVEQIRQERGTADATGQAGRQAGRLLNPQRGE